MSVTKNNNYNKWSESYKIHLASERKKNRRTLFLAIVTFLTLIWSVKLFYTGEYKFIFQETLIINAKIERIGIVHVRGGGFYQRLHYKYIYNSREFLGHENIGKFVGMKKEGDIIKLKISKSNPNRHKIIEY